MKKQRLTKEAVQATLYDLLNVETNHSSRTIKDKEWLLEAIEVYPLVNRYAIPHLKNDPVVFNKFLQFANTEDVFNFLEDITSMEEEVGKALREHDNIVLMLKKHAPVAVNLDLYHFGSLYFTILKHLVNEEQDFYKEAFLSFHPRNNIQKENPNNFVPYLEKIFPNLTIKSLKDLDKRYSNLVTKDDGLSFLSPLQHKMLKNAIFKKEVSSIENVENKEKSKLSQRKWLK